MKTLRILTALPILALVACSSNSTIDEYHYGYAPAYRTLPAGFEQSNINGTNYWHNGGRFYKLDAEKGYLLVDPPRGSEQIVAAASGATPAPSGDALPAKRKSWLAPGDGELRLSERSVQIGRSPIRRKVPVLNP